MDAIERKKQMDYLKKNIWDLLYGPSIDNFGGRYIEDLLLMPENNVGRNCVIGLVIKYLQAQLRQFIDMVD